MSGKRSTTSCRACRIARIGCDAAIQRPLPCSNCTRRGKLCDPQGNPHKQKHARRSYDHVDFYEARSQGADTRHFASSDLYTLPSPSSFDLETAACYRFEADVLNGLLWEIYISVFESRFAIWLGDSCCPYLEMNAPIKVSITRLVLQLDAYEDDLEQGSAQNRVGATERFSKLPYTRADSKSLLNETLRNAICAYSVRWLPLRSAFQGLHEGGSGSPQRREQEVRDCLWHRARQSISAALTRPSYRSILALFLFTLTEMPMENDDQGIGQLCSQTMLAQFNILKSPLRWSNLRPLAQSTTALPVARGSQELVWRSRPDESMQHKRDAMFWIGVVCDASRALIQQQPAMLLPAGSDDRKIWDFIRQRTAIFDQSFRGLQGSQVPLPPDVVVVVLQHATACKTMYLGVINQLCDAILYSNMTSISDTAQVILTDVRRFHDVFDQLLSMCAADYVMLTPEGQLNYLLMVTHYHLGTLILADILDRVDVVPEPLKDPAFSRLRACQGIVNALNLAQNCDRYSRDDPVYRSRLLLDPTPELMVEVLSRTAKAILSIYDGAEIRSHTAQITLSTVFSALNVLSQISNTASFVLSSCRHLCSERNLKVNAEGQHADLLMAAPENLPILAACDAASVDKFLQEIQIQASLDPSYLDNMINKFENKVSSMSAGPTTAPSN